MSNKAWERRRRNKKVRLLVRRIRKSFDVEKFFFPHYAQPFTVYVERENFYRDFLLPQQIGMMVMSPREFVEIKYVP